MVKREREREINYTQLIFQIEMKSVHNRSDFSVTMRAVYCVILTHLTFLLPNERYAAFL